VLFDLPDRALKASDRLLRLREYRGRSVLTFKAPVAGEHRHKVRVEHELTVSDSETMRSILSGLGFAIVYRYQKYRATYRLGAVEAAVDETALGTFVELEGPPDDVDRAAAALGASPSDFIRATYRELQEKDAASRGVVAGDLLLPSSFGPEAT
jgi:adenylate cyclase class 2